MICVNKWDAIPERGGPDHADLRGRRAGAAAPHLLGLCCVHQRCKRCLPRHYGGDSTFRSLKLHSLPQPRFQQSILIREGCTPFTGRWNRISQATPSAYSWQHFAEQSPARLWLRLTPRRNLAGQRVSSVLKAAQLAGQQHQKRVTTATLNIVVRSAPLGKLHAGNTLPRAAHVSSLTPLQAVILLQQLQCSSNFRACGS